MKKAILGLFFLLFTSNVQAQSPSFNFVRSTEVPGYFLVEILPDTTKPAMDINNVFVINYEKKEQKKYAEVLDVIKDIGGIIKSKEEVKTEITLQKNRYFSIGEPIEGLTTFTINKKEKALEEFDYFLQEFLYPVYMKNIQSTFGGNVYDVVPLRIPFGSSQGDVFVGKFRKAMKTRMEITAQSNEGMIIASTILDFTDTGYTKDPIAKELKYIWQDFATPPKEASPEKKAAFFKWANRFPLILIFLGIFIIIAGFKWFGKKEQKEDGILPKNFWDNAPTTLLDKKDQEILQNDEDLPFEIKIKK